MILEIWLEAYWTLTEKGTYGEAYNIAGDYTCTVGEMLNVLLTMTEVKPEIVVDPELLRKSDVTLQVPDTRKFKAATNWTPRIEFKETLSDILNFWREQVHRENQ